MAGPLETRQGLVAVISMNWSPARPAQMLWDEAEVGESGPLTRAASYMASCPSWLWDGGRARVPDLVSVSHLFVPLLSVSPADSLCKCFSLFQHYFYFLVSFSFCPSWAILCLSPWPVFSSPSLCMSLSLPAPHTHRPMWDTFIRLSGTSSFPFFSHTPRTFSSETSHLNTAWSLAPTARSAMLWYTSSFFSGGRPQPVSLGEWGSVDPGWDLVGWRVMVCK